RKARACQFQKVLLEALASDHSKLLCRPTYLLLVARVSRKAGNRRRLALHDLHYELWADWRSVLTRVVAVYRRTFLFGRSLASCALRVEAEDFSTSPYD